jgi:hypothetical protein
LIVAKKKKNQDILRLKLIGEAVRRQAATHLAPDGRKVLRGGGHVQPQGVGLYQTRGVEAVETRSTSTFSCRDDPKRSSNPSNAKANTMARPLAPLAALLLLVLSLAAAASAADAPFVVAHKKVALSRPKPGVERLAISVDLYNQGSASVPSLTSRLLSWIPIRLLPYALLGAGWEYRDLNRGLGDLKPEEV